MFLSLRINLLSLEPQEEKWKQRLDLPLILEIKFSFSYCFYLFIFFPLSCGHLLFWHAVFVFFSLGKIASRCKGRCSVLSSVLPSQTSFFSSTKQMVVGVRLLPLHDFWKPCWGWWTVLGLFQHTKTMLLPPREVYKSHFVSFCWRGGGGGAWVRGL